ncbi:MAG: protease pro-enzyme activation domain-containing protein [Candidatus Limnocylindrales bacterium]
MNRVIDGGPWKVDRDPVDERFVALAGSEHAPVAGVRLIGPVGPAEPVVVTIVLRPAQSGTAPAAGARPLTRPELARLRAARPDDLSAVRAFARAFGLRVERADRAARTISLAGTADAFERAFRVRLARYEHGSAIYRGHSGPIQLPVALAESVVAVLGLDERPAAKRR